eukprot:m.248371 g.248371  ORF g.248371 m.248371 type:complete len:855 (-) comp22611_c0_seq1:254-2818(-)
MLVLVLLLLCCCYCLPQAELTSEQNRDPLTEESPPLLRKLLSQHALHHRDRITVQPLGPGHERVRRSTALPKQLRVTVPWLSDAEEITLQLQHSTHVSGHGLVLEAVDAAGTRRPFDLDLSRFYRGTVVGHVESQVTAHIDRDGSLTAVVVLHGALHMIEPADAYGHIEHVVVYRASDMVWPALHSNHSSDGRVAPPPGVICGHKDHHPYSPLQQGESWRHTESPVLRRQRRDVTKNTCGLTIEVDSRFFVSRGSNLATTSNTIINFINFIDSRLRQTDFNGITNVGVAIKRLTVYESSVTDPYYQSAVWVPEDLLLFLARRDWSTTCLTHLFTHQDFDGGVQGMAYVASSSSMGICDNFNEPNQTYYLNVGLTTTLNFGANVLQLMAILVTQHELGHNFGSNHDPATALCQPSEAAGGDYVMYASSVDGSETNHISFSPCSRDSMSAVLSARSSVCFEPEPQALCGNGRVEPNGVDGINGTSDDEECDAGYSGDECCTASCKLQPTATCSDANSECCRNCTHAGDVYAGAVLVHAAKLCYQEFAFDPQCRGNTYCVNSSFTCPTLNQKPAGSECRNGGKCESNSDPSLRCVSMCAQFGGKDCACANSGDECKLCCEDDPTQHPYCDVGFVWTSRTHTNGTTATACFNETETTWTDSSDVRPGGRAFGASCVLASSVLGQPVFGEFRTAAGLPFNSTTLVKTVGTTCDGGQCGEGGVCLRSKNDFTSQLLGFIGSLSVDSIRAFMRKNVVGSAIVFSLPVWILVSYCIRRSDKKKIAKLKADMKHIRSKRKNTFKVKSNQRGQAARVAGNQVAPTARTPDPTAGYFPSQRRDSQPHPRYTQSTDFRALQEDSFT